MDELPGDKTPADEPATVLEVVRSAVVEPLLAAKESVGEPVRQAVAPIKAGADALAHPPDDGRSFHLASARRTFRMDFPSRRQFERWLVWLLAAWAALTVSAMAVAGVLGGEEWVVAVALVSEVPLLIMLLATLLALAASCSAPEPPAMTAPAKPTSAMTARVGVLDPAARAAEKQRAREADARALSSGEKTAAQLKADNEAFAFSPGQTRINLSSARSLS